MHQKKIHTLKNKHQAGKRKVAIFLQETECTTLANILPKIIVKIKKRLRGYFFR